MGIDFSQQVETKKTYRLITTGPVCLKDHGFVWGILLKKFKELNGRDPSRDNDVWLEPYNEGIAYCFEVKTTEEDHNKETK